MKKESFLILIIIITTLIVGLLNTLFIKSEDVGTWKNYVGYGFLLLAAINIFFLVKKHLKRENNEN